MKLTPQRKTFDYVYVNELNIIYYDIFYETLVKSTFMLSLFISRELLFKRVDLV